MRPFIPKTLNAEGLTALQQHRAASRIEDTARHDGYQQGLKDGQLQGFKEGDAAAREELEPRLDALEAALAERIRMDSLADTLRKVLTQHEDERRAMEEECANAIEAALQLVFPTLMKAAEGQEAAVLLRQALQERDADQLEIRAHPYTMERLRQVMRDLPADAWTKIRATPDQSLDSGAADISWTNGGVIYDPAALLAKVTKALKIETTAAPKRRKAAPPVDQAADQPADASPAAETAPPISADIPPDASPKSGSKTGPKAATTTAQPIPTPEAG